VKMSILHRVPRTRQDYHLSEMEGEFLLYNHERMTTIYLNESAAAVWRLCDGQRTVAAIVEFLRAVYPGAARQLEADVCGAIQQFVNDHMVTLD
jgi:Coenzyme PQQ synthesis protein D (PqqD)